MTEQTTAEAILSTLTNWALAVIFALVILFVGFWIAKKLKGLFLVIMEKKSVEPTVAAFLGNILYGAIAVFVIIAAIGKLGVNTTSFAAVIAAAGLAIGLALQGSLSNFASGVLLILFKPFVAGDVVKAGGELGSVIEVGILTTELKTPDNVKIIMPNAAIMSGPITNITAHDTRRVDMVVGVGYGDNLDKAKTLIEAVIAEDSRVLSEPAPQVAVSNLGDSSVDFIVRPWVKKEDYWGVKFDFTKAIKERFDAEGISIPFPQRDIHIFNEDAS